jgi:alpha-glucosidase
MGRKDWSAHLRDATGESERSGYSRREFLGTALVAPVLTAELLHAAVVPGARQIRVSSPNGRVTLQLFERDSRLFVDATFGNTPVIEASPLGIAVDGADLCREVDTGAIETYRIDERYAWRGVHAEAVNRCEGARISLMHRPSRTSYTLDVRAFDDGAAFRFIVPGTGSRVPNENTTFILPPASTVWYHDLRGHYEGTHARKSIADVEAGEWAAPPLTFRLPDDRGYASITEAAVIDYAGMALQSDGRRGFVVRLGHAHPASYPFTLRYGDEAAARLAIPAAVSGTITTPWRVLMIGADLNDLVNSDIVHNLAPAADPRIFPDGLHTDWIRPGRCVWKYLDGGGENTLATMKEFSRLAGQLGFEYHLVEGFWQRWPESDVRELVDYSRQHGVGIWLWKHSRDLRDAAAREAFFAHARAVGAVGVKLDFFDHEAREVMDLYRAALEGAARHRLMVNFHGANKPTGEARTWPNELTREAVSGMERRSMPAWSQHDATIPFTRMLAGHLDFTPMVFGERRRETSWAHQIATAAIFDSPLLVFGAHPQSILDNPAADMIRSIPSVWDETHVLPFSEIGEIAGFARRAGRRWFLVIANGPTPRSLDLPLSFLGDGSHQALLVHDEAADAAAVRLQTSSLRRADSLRVELRAGGGFIGRFSDA